MIKRIMPGGCAALVSVGVMVTAIGAQAQTLDEITVTARKTEENLQEVPLAITALGAEQIDRLGIKDLADLAQQDSSVQFDEGFTPSDTRITIRGLSPTRGRPNAATLIDGIDITSEAVSNAGGSLLIDPRLIDVQRVEIIKGPQSALYGRSAFAGAVQYVTKDPDDVLSGGLFVDYNINGDEEVRGNVSIPITDTLGVRFNGLAWNSDGYYRNAATGDKIGGGKGAGGTLTVLWEPTDNVRLKWRTDYTDDHFDVAAQALLNDRNQFFDLGDSGGLDPSRSNLAPLSGQRLATAQEILDGVAVDRAGCVNTAAGGFLDNYACGDGLVLYEYLINREADPNFSDNNPQGVGRFDINDDWQRNVYNKQVVSAYVGKFPKGDDLKASISPDYRLSSNPYDAKDFAGTDRIVFRNSLVIDWNINDSLTFTSYSGFTDAKENTATDIGKYYVDNCRPDPADPREPQFANQICDQGDGINDSPIIFQQDSNGDTKQLSQEFRLAWDINDDFRLTQGVQYWRERVAQEQLNQTVITGGPLCYLAFDPVGGGVTDASLWPPTQGFLTLNPTQHQCGDTWLPAAYWVDDALQVRPTDLLERETDHYSWYGQLQWNVTDRFKATFEARFTREDNGVNGQAQTVCLEGISDEFLANPDNPAKGILSPFRDASTGRVLCQGFNTNNADPDNPIYTNAFGSEYSAFTGPGSVIICGQTGRCDTLDQAVPGAFPSGGTTTPVVANNSWWPYGFRTQPAYDTSLARKDRYWAPKATLEYFWNDDVMTYFSWSRGIKPGGFSLLTQGAFGLDANGDGIYDEVEFEPERLDVWELGAKTTLFDNRLRLNGSVFFQDFKDKQVTVQAVVGEALGTKVENISGSEIKGLELDATFQATDNLLLQAGYTYLDSEYTDYTIVTTSPNDIARVQLGNGKGCTEIAAIDPNSPAVGGNRGCVASFNGNQLERTPKHSFLLNATYTNNLFDTGLDWFGTVNFRYQDSRFVEAWNIVEFEAYTLTNVSLGIESDVWDVQLYVNNLFDDDTVISGGANPGLPTGSFGFGFETVNGLVPPGVNAGPKLPSDAYANLPNPRILGVRANFRFGG